MKTSLIVFLTFTTCSAISLISPLPVLGADPAGAPIVIELTGDDAMQFSTKELSAPAGATVKLVFKHIGVMPVTAMGHNFVLLQSGTVVLDFGMACATSTLEQNYLPVDAKKDLVIAASKMIGGGQQAEVTFTVPSPGKYPYLCSFPGHFAAMNGVFTSEGPAGDAVAATRQTEPPGSATPVEPASSTIAESALQGDSAIGEKLFVGLIRLENKGPSCNSCHHVNNDNVMAGGSLAKDLSREYTFLGGAISGELAIEAFLSGTPFPAMKNAYGRKPLTKDEMANLAAFLRQADQTHAEHKQKNYGKTLLYSGVFGAAILMGVFPMLWRKRKRGSVNNEIYDRQISSDN